MLKAVFCSERKINFTKKLKKKQTYLFSQTQFMTIKPENMFSFYDPHNIICQTFRFLSACFSLGGEKKE